MTEKTTITKTLNHCLRNQSGQGLTEYIALVLLIAVVSIAATKSLGNTVKSKMEEARQHIDSDIVIK